MEEVDVVLPFFDEVIFQYINDMVGTDDTAVAPYLHDVPEIDAPSVLLVGLIDDVNALRKRSKECRVDGVAELLQYLGLLVIGPMPLLKGKAAVEC